jgi:hypothetical protein
VPLLALNMTLIEQSRRTALALLLVLQAGDAYAHGGAAGAGCGLRLGAWRWDIALYQPASRDGEMFCEVLPGNGATVLLFDAVDAALATMPIELRVVRVGPDTAGIVSGSWDTAAVEAATVAHVPATVHANGTLQLQHDFNTSGPYLALLRTPAPNGGEWRAAFRFTVGTATTRWLQVATIIAGTLFGFGLLAWARRRDPYGASDIIKHNGNSGVNA